MSNQYIIPTHSFRVTFEYTCRICEKLNIYRQNINLIFPLLILFFREFINLCIKDNISVYIKIRAYIDRFEK